MSLSVVSLSLRLSPPLGRGWCRLLSSGVGVVRVTSSSEAPPPLTLTRSCVDKLSSLPDPLHLRLSVDAGGCSGFTYVFQLEDPKLTDPQDDVVVKQDGATAVVDRDSVQ